MTIELQIDVERLARDRRGLLAGLGAEHVERQHHPALAGMPRGPPGVAIDLHQLRHLRAGQRNAHQVMALPSGVLERFLGRQRGDPERRPRLLGRARQRRHLFEAVEAALRGDVLLLQQAANLLQALVEAGAALVHRDAEAGELVRQEGARETDLHAAVGDRVDHADLAGELQRIVEHRQHRAGDEPDGPRDRAPRR